MAESEGYWSKHHTGIIQCILGFYCAAFATWEHFNPRTPPAASTAHAGGAPMIPRYAMPFWLWAGIVALALSVVIPAIVGLVRKRSLRKLGQAEESGGDQRPTKLRKKFSWANSERIRLEKELNTKGQLHAEEVRKLEVSHEADLRKATVIREQLTLEKQLALNKISELEAKLEMFSPLQLEAFKLANEIQAFYAELGPEPKYPKELEDRTAEGIWNALAKHNQALLPYRTRLEYGFERRFAKRTMELVQEFAEKGIQNSSIRITSVKFPFLGVEEEKALPSNIRELANQLADQGS
jgi:hypothetical protein